MVRRDILLSAVFGALGASAAVVEKRQSSGGLTDADILSFALVLEHLEATFYSGALSNFTKDDFTKAGYGNNVYANIQTIAADEATHVEFLTSALSAAGATPPKACTYSFGYKDVNSFLATSQILEGVGVSAYLGAAQYIQNPAYLTAAGAILTAEARHNAFIRYVNQYSPFVAFDTPLTPTAVQSVATPFFVSCPDGSAPPFTPFPAATLTSTNATIGSTINVNYNASTSGNNSTQLYCVFLSGLQQAHSTFENGSCTIPSQNLTTGQAYGVISSAMTFNDSTVVAGPFVLNFDTKNNTGAGSSSQAAGSNSNSNLAVNGTGAGSKITAAFGGLTAAVIALGSALLL